MGDVIRVDFTPDYRPVKAACAWCGTAWNALVRSVIDATSRLECPRCHLAAGCVTREYSDDWDESDYTDTFVGGPDGV